MDGIAATKEIRGRRHTMPIIAATASFSQTDRAMCIAAGMSDILPKPFTKQAVRVVLCTPKQRRHTKHKRTEHTHTYSEIAPLNYPNTRKRSHNQVLQLHTKTLTHALF